MTAHAMVIQIRGHEPHTLTIAPSGALTRDTGSLDERDVTVAVRTLVAHGHEELAGRVQGWWWMAQGA